jgi:two-component sensor histidine kinase/PAS domain-containing protein
MTKGSSARAFLLAGTITAVAVAVAVSAALDRVLPGMPPFITLYPAVAVAGVLCGAGAAAMSALIGVIAALYLWIPPRMSFAAPSLTNCIAIAIFASASGIVLWTAAALRAQLTSASLAKHWLDLSLAAGGVGTWELDLRNRRITASATAYALHGLPADQRETTPEDWLRGVPPDDAEAARRALAAAVAEGGVASYTYRVSHPAEETRWVTSRGRVVSLGGDRRLLCALVDITDEVRVQEALRREQERLRLALAAGALAVWDYCPESGAATVDTQYAVTMGFDPALTTLTRAEIGARIHPEDRLRVAMEHEASVKRGGTDYSIEYRIITRGGEVRWVVSQGIMIKGERPAEAGRMVGIIQDITERKRREDVLRDLAAAREILVREADHRIKNSLQLVISLLSVQLRSIADPVVAAALRGAITRVGAIAASHKALQASEDLKEVDLGSTLADLCAHFAELAPGVAILCRPPAGLLLDADRAIPLALAVSEVLTNALRHAFPGRMAGEVVVEAARHPAELMVRVSDDGIGMKPRPDGEGLGSRIIRSLTARLGATIVVESRPQTGTTVTLRLPLEAETPRRATG